jgi:predicted DNA-binding transcriptional regulator AlpA
MREKRKLVFIRRKALSDALGIVPNTTRYWERTGKLPKAVKLGKNVVVWKIDDLPEQFRALLIDKPQSKSA